MSVTTTVIRTSAVQGPPGLSAYQIAVRNGFVGTEEQWSASLRAVVRETLVVGNVSPVWTNVVSDITWPSGTYNVTLIANSSSGETVFTGMFPWSQQTYSDAKPADLIVLASHGNTDVTVELHIDYSGLDNASLQIRSIGVEVPTVVNMKVTQIA